MCKLNTNFTLRYMKIQHINQTEYFFTVIFYQLKSPVKTQAVKSTSQTDLVQYIQKEKAKIIIKAFFFSIQMHALSSPTAQAHCVFLVGGGPI